VPIGRIALAYLISQAFTTIPIVGCRTPEQLGESMKAADVELDVSMLNYLTV